MEEDPIIDSAISLEEALGQLSVPQEIRDAQVLIDVEYISFDEKLHRGQVLLHKNVAADLQEIFAEIRKIRFPIQKAVPIVAYDWDDENSMQDNNTSAFNYRVIYGTDRLSNHSYGLAIDINPLLNPYYAIDGSTQPKGSVYDPNKPGTLQDGDAIVSLFLERGWKWLGHDKRKDWQHFDKLSARE